MTQIAKERSQFLVILLIVFLGFLGISMPYLIFPALFLNPAYSIVSENIGEFTKFALLGITLAAYPLGQFFGSPVLGSLSDDYGRKPILTTSLFITAICNLITGFAIYWQMLWLLILSRLIAGLMEGNISIARAMATDLPTISKHDAFGKINAAASIAYLIGPLFGGLLTDKELFEGLTISTPFYFICIFFVALTFLSIFVIEDHSNPKNRKVITILERINLIRRLSLLFTNNRLRFLMLTSTLFTLAVDIFYEFGPIYLTLKWELNPSDLIIYNASLCAGLAIGNGILPAYFTQFSKPSVIINSITTFSLFLLAIILTNSTHLMIVLFGLCGLSIGLAVTFLTVKISNSVPDSIQGEVLGAQVSLRVLGDAIICLFGGFLLFFSSKIILVFATLVSFVSMGFYSYKKNKV